MQTEACELAGLRLHPVGMSRCLEILQGYIESGGTHHVATANTDFFVHLRHHAHILDTVDLTLVDGMPLVWLLRRLGHPAQRVTGADLVPRLASLAARHGYRMFFLGAAPGVAEDAVSRLRASNPDLPPVEVLSPPILPLERWDHEAVLERIARFRPHILVVALGAPKQERWIHMHRARLDVPVCIGVGGSLDIVAGRFSRAPLFMQQAGFEWLYRLAQEPRRLWRRYTRDAVIFVRLSLTVLGRRLSRR